MDDRGLSLTPADMLKGHLLASIADSDDRVHTGRVWKDRMASLAELGKDEDADGIKSWLRSQFATTIRERKSGAAPEDFDLRAQCELRRPHIREEARSLRQPEPPGPQPPPKRLRPQPGFARFIEQTGLPFRPHIEFRKADLDHRQALYIQLASQIWSPDRLEQEASS